MPLRVTTLIQRILNGKEEHAMKKYYVMLLMAAALVACSKEQEVADPKETPSVKENLVPMQFSASLEDAGTKTDLNTSTGAVSWTDTDEVAFYWEVNRKDDGTKNISSATSTSTEIDGSNANFTVAVPDDFSLSDSDFEARYSAVDPSDNVSRHMYAVYPATTTVDYSTGSSLFVTIPATQDGTFANASIAVAKWAAPGEALVFNNLCGLVQVVVADDAVRKIELSSSAEIAGKLSVTFPKEGDNLGKPVEKAISEGVNTITVNVSGAGTYYIAVRPVDITDLYVALYDSSDDLIGDKMSSNVLSVARKQIRKLGTIATGLSDRLYFTQDGAGTKDGSSWDNAMESSSLATEMATTSSINKSFYLAAGNYLVENKACKPESGSTIKIYGGYPASPTGKSLSGRDTDSNISKIYTTSNRAFWTQMGNWIFDGLTFTSKGYTGTAGGAAMLLLAGTQSASINNCKFASSVVSTANSGVVRVAIAATFTNCEFTGNSTQGSGGAMWVVSGGTATLNDCTFNGNSAVHGGAINVAGTLIANRCTFEGNTVTQHGGAIVSNNATIKLSKCIFIDNKTSEGSEPYAADLYLGGTTTAYVNASYFGQSTDSFTPATNKPHRILTGGNVNFGMNNCVVSGPFGKSNQVNTLQGNTVIVNTTMYAQASAACVLAGSSNADGCRIINSIVSNGSANQHAFTANASKYIQAYNTIYSLDGTSEGTFTATDCVSSKYYGVFPDNSPWAQKYLGTAFTWDDGRSAKAYVWDGVCDGFTKTSLASIKPLINGTTTVGSGFLTWLESDDLKVNGVEALAVDIRGNARNTSAMWPGSYEQTSGVASAPAFSVK